MSDLSILLQHDPVRLEPLAEHHLAPLKAACEEDQEIWDIYPVDLRGDNFMPAMETFHRSANWVRFAAIDTVSNTVVGMTNYIQPDFPRGVTEIGGTYIAPRVRGTGYNDVMKQLMIDHAFALGFRRIEFRVDERNRRSRAAVLKLGAIHEGTLRAERITWTGHIRNTCIFGLLKEEWQR
jgi:RimJ/RimL family protein N-acetyltransferase